ncbi:MAG TPA: metallophosphoesterase [Steroidobacteraceae bacterium]|nr:metallophosphoesterase [Steroidobacteraceae bacterium]
MHRYTSLLRRGNDATIAFRFLAVACALLLLSASAWGDSPYRFTGAQRIVVFADVHGAYTELLSVLNETGIIDAAQHWHGGATQLVSTGDLLDRGPDARKVLDLLMRLEQEAPKAGGAVHVILGNHEVMNLVGDLRYVPAAEFAAFAGPEDTRLREEVWQRVLAQEPAAARAEFDRAFPAGYFGRRQAFSPEGQYGRWLLEKPFLITVNDTAFVHGGLPDMVARSGLDETNRTLHAELTDYLQKWQTIETEQHLARPVPFSERPQALAAAGAAELSATVATLQDSELFTPKGPTWFRGQALCYPYSEAETLDGALAKLGVARVVEGHTPSPTGRVLSRFDGRVVLLDTGMLRAEYKGHPAAYVFENGQWSVAYAENPGQRVQPDALPRAVGARPAGLDDDALESWLAQAEIVEVDNIDTGITKPQRVTLRKDGVELRAVFKQLSTDFGIQDRFQAMNESDRYQYELAAYKLDRLIGLDMVPVTILRSVKDKPGALQFWIDDSINVKAMIDAKVRPSGWCDSGSQYNLMNVWDVLIHNADRNQGNALWTKDWTLVLIDHTRAFGAQVQNPTLLYRGGAYVPPALAKRLATLNQETLTKTLGQYLQRRQIDAILKRRDLLLKNYTTRPAAGGAGD